MISLIGFLSFFVLSLKSKVVECGVGAARCPASLEVCLACQHSGLHSGQIVATWSHWFGKIAILVDDVPLVH